jgi:hypothetical protein
MYEPELQQISVTGDPADRWISLSQAAALIPSQSSSKPVLAAVVARWISRGVKAPDGRRVRLQAVRCGSRWMTTRAWLEQFARDQTPSFNDDIKPPQSDSRRERAAREAGKRLELMGA